MLWQFFFLSWNPFKSNSGRIKIFVSKENSFWSLCFWPWRNSFFSHTAMSAAFYDSVWGASKRQENDDRFKYSLTASWNIDAAVAGIKCISVSVQNMPSLLNLVTQKAYISLISKWKRNVFFFRLNFYRDCRLLWMFDRRCRLHRRRRHRCHTLRRLLRFPSHSSMAFQFQCIQKYGTKSEANKKWKTKNERKNN